MQSGIPAISVRNLSKCYKLGTIGRHTLVDECQYLWHKLRGRDPRQHIAKISHTATKALMKSTVLLVLGGIWQMAGSSPVVQINKASDCVHESAILRK